MDIQSCKKNDYVLPGVLSGLQRYIHSYFSGEQPRTQDKMEDRCFGYKTQNPPKKGGKIRIFEGTAYAVPLCF